MSGSAELLLLVLRLLEKRAMDAPELVAALEELLTWRQRPSTGEVLLALDALEAERLVEVSSAGGPDRYEIAAAGSAAVSKRAGVTVPRRSTAAPRFASRRASSPRPEEVTILFTDIVRSTEMLDALGDEAAHELRRRHFGLLRRTLATHAGREVKSLGDGLMVVFGSPPAAANCAVAMQAAVAECDDELQLRIGIATGETVREDDDYFGRAVVVARRLCDQAGDGETLIAGPAENLVDDARIEREHRGPTRLKGLSEPVHPTVLRAPALATAA